MRWAWPLVLIGLLACSPASACPDCETALLTRRRVASEDVAWRIGVTLLPFAISVAGAVIAGRTLDRRNA